MAAPDVGGSFPVNSNLWIRDFKSSNSSHTVDGAVVETVDSVPSAARGVSGTSCMSVVRETSGDELYVRGVVYDRFDWRYDDRCGRFASGTDGRRPLKDGCSGEISLPPEPLGVVGLERELTTLYLLPSKAAGRSLPPGR